MSFQVVRQKDAMQCGIACVSMVCRHYGAPIGIDEIEKICPASREGVSLLAISETARALGLDNEAAKISLGKLAQVPVPCILHWNQNHFVVLYRVSKNGKYFYVADPGKGRIRYATAEFASHWCADADGKGIVMALEPTEEFNRHRDRIRTQRRGLRFIMGYMARYRRLFSQIVLGLLAAFAAAMALIPSPYDPAVSVGRHIFNSLF